MYKKKLVRLASGKIDAVNDTEKIDDMMAEPAFDLAWAILNSAIPDQIPYCPKCLSEGGNYHKKDGFCKRHKGVKIKYAFVKLSPEMLKDNIEFAERETSFISATCDASSRKFDDKKIIKGITAINKNNHVLNIDAIKNSFTTFQKLNNLLKTV